MTARKLWWIVLVGIFLAGTAAAQTVRLLPVPPHVKPRWTKMPESPRVYYAPNVPADVFRGPGGYYLRLDGNWYQSKMLNGPWTVVRQVPDFLAGITPTYFKSGQASGVKKPAAPPAAVTAPAVEPPESAGTAPMTPQAGTTAGLIPGATAPATTPASPGTATGDSTTAATPPDATSPAPAPEPIYVYDPGPP